MAEDRLTIDRNTLLDNSDDHVVEFDAEEGDDRSAFAVSYAVLEALSGDVRPANPAALVERHAEAIERAAARAFGGGSGIGRTVIDEGDLD